MLCPKCKEGLIVVDIKVTPAYSDYRESWPEKIDITYKCNVCLHDCGSLDPNQYPTNLAGLRKMIQKNLNNNVVATHSNRDGANYPGNS